MFEELNRTRDDACAQATQVFENQSQADYVLTNPIHLRLVGCANGDERKKDDRCNSKTTFHADGTVSVEKTGSAKENCARADEFALKHRNLRSWSGGPGIQQKDVDVDSFMRLESDSGLHSHPQQLPARVFQGVPDRRRGRPRPNTETRLLHSKSTTVKRREAEITPTEMEYDVFHPTVDMPSTKNIISSIPRGGRSSRDINRSPGFLKSIGYEWNGRTWSLRDSSI